ncbi:MAG: Ribosomal protein S12 methylthiotransferase RimO [candidate division BRC1 bacterium ADurb.BinA364]|nr:MAG: Ribosomal protein S12 methylthiotransferase RimO [candidate division BRC1 bacterium ADurb.BinA364]
MKIGLVTLGCDKNTADNEYLAGLLAQRGHSVEVARDAKTRYDAVVITTCGFIEAAKAQSMCEIDRWAARKRQTGRPERLIVAGCLTQRYAEEVLQAYPEIDGLSGVGQFDALADLIEEADPASGDVCLALADKPSVRIDRPVPRLRLDRGPHAFLKIADGCDHGCSFCCIPRMKGPSVSTPIDILIEEAKSLIAGGVKEINVIGQDLTLYGRDFDSGKPGLEDLLERLDALHGDFWIRLLYVYPGGVTDRLLELMARGGKICPYLDVPLQHLDPRMLKAMRRPGGSIGGERLFERIRAAVPGVALRTTLLVGFPGETDAMFEAMLDAVKRMRVDRLGAFIYSREEGTPAYSLPDQIPPEVAQQRFDRLMRAQAEIAFELSRQRVGRRERVLLEGRDRERGAAIGRGRGDAFEIDGRVYVKGAGPKRMGQFANVEIVAADGYDVWAKMLKD